MTRLIVDGMNVIGSRPDGWWNDPDSAVLRFVEELQGFAEASGEEVTVVFDRRPPGMREGKHGSVGVAFAQWRGRNAADREIVRMVEEDDDRDSLVVVSSDRDLTQKVKALGAGVEPAGRFRNRLDRS